MSERAFRYLRHRRDSILPLVALGLAAVAWLITLQLDIGGADNPWLMDDSGEFVIAWNTWGVAHPPGYPLLNALANVFTHLLRVIGVPPVTSASLFSFACGVAAFAVLAAIVRDAGDDGLGAAVAIIVAAFGPIVWLYNSVAEVYALGLLLGFAALWLALGLGRAPDTTTALALGFVIGLALGHHRTLALLLPAIAVAAWPARRLGWRTWLGALALGVASLGVYFYLPIVAHAGSPWVYGRSPATLAGFLDAVAAREYGDQLAPTLALPAIASALIGRLGAVRDEMGLWLAVLGGLSGAVALWSRSTRRHAVVLWVIFLCFLLAPVGQKLLIETHMPVMVACLALGVLAGLGVAAIPARWALWRWSVVGLVVLLAAAAVWVNSFRVAADARDPEGRRLIEAVRALGDPTATILEMWSPRYFALAYAKLVTRELPDINLVNSRPDLNMLPLPGDEPAVIYTTPSALVMAPPKRWAKRLGHPVFMESAGEGLIAVRRQPRLAPAAAPPSGEDDGTGIAVRSKGVWLGCNGDALLTVEWQALREPATEYAVFVHVTDKDVIAGPGDILASGDREHPVYGFAPTDKWVPGQLVRDDYRVPVPSGSRWYRVEFGLYTRAPDGSFENHLVQSVSLQESGGCSGP